MDVILSTRNPSKAEQIQAIFADLPIKILTLDQAGIKGEALEDGQTLEENALKKAIYAYVWADSDIWTMADDTGLFIDALNGEPGIRAARWAGENATTEEITKYTLQRLEGHTNRSATFVTAVAVVTPNGDHTFFKAQVRGRILEQPRVKPQPKMPYSPIFVPEGSERVWAEMSVEEENNISHRGKAFRQVRGFFEREVIK